MNLMMTSLFAFLPKQYRTTLLRGGEVSRRSALLSGLIEFLASLDLLVHYYFAFANHWLASVPGQVVNGSMMAEGEVGLMGLGGFVLIGFILQPLTVVLLYFVVEGAARATAATVSGEIRGSLPFWLVAYLQAKWKEWREESKLGSRVPDLVENLAPESGELRIASCRPKADWDDRVTISYRQKLYELASQETGTAPRRYIYVLRQKPEYKLIRALRYYDPEEVLTARK
jgi:hypothetical protein